MNISAILPSQNSSVRKQNIPTFAGETVFSDKKVVEKDILSLYDSKSIFENTLYPNSKLLGIKLQRNSDKNISLVSRYGNNIGNLIYNPDVNQPMINLQIGSFQPIIEMTDDELGITVLMTRGSNLKGKDLNIGYKGLSNNISFGHKLVVTTGYKPEKTEDIVENYKTEKRYNDLLSDDVSAKKNKRRLYHSRLRRQFTA